MSVARDWDELWLGVKSLSNLEIAATNSRTHFVSALQQDGKPGPKNPPLSHPKLKEH